MQPRTRDYTDLIAEFWPTIMRAWDDFGKERIVIECDVVNKLVLAYSARDYIGGLNERTREATRRQYRRVTAQGGMMVFIRDSRRRVLQSHVFVPRDEASGSGA